MNVEQTQHLPRTQAGVERSRWPGWIWAIPIAALGVIAWLGFRSLANQGQDITITFDDVHGLSKQGSEIVYRGLTIGHVNEVSLSDDRRSVTVQATVDADATPMLRTGTRFWLQGASPSLSNLSSLGAVLSGPKIGIDPGPGDKATHFHGLAHAPIAPAADSKPQIYQMSFDGDVGDLQPGDPVKLRGFTVGEVRQIGFAADPANGTVTTPVTLALYPSLFHTGPGKPPADPAALATVVDALVQHGLRAKLERQPPFIGSEHVVLEMQPGASPPPASSSSSSANTGNAQPQIPIASAGGGIGAVVSKLENLPLPQIAQNLLDVTKHLDDLVADPQLHTAERQLADTMKKANDAMSQANHAAARIDAAISSSSPKLEQLIRRLDSTSAQLERLSASANRAVNGSLSQYGIETATREVTEAARALRALANYLDRHPEALIQGRRGG